MCVALTALLAVLLCEAGEMPGDPALQLTVSRLSSLLDAAAAGGVEDRYQLGNFYVGSAGQRPDYAGAMWWYLQAADLGDKNAQYEVAKLYAQGRGTVPNWIIATKWMSLAADAGNPDAVADRDQLETALTPKARADASLRVHEWKQRHTLGALRAAGRDEADYRSRVAVMIDGFALSDVKPFISEVRGTTIRTQQVAYLGADYRAEFIFTESDPALQVVYTIEQLDAWDFFSNFRLKRDPTRAQVKSPLGMVEYQRLATEDQTSCVVFQHVWSSGAEAPEPGLRWDAGRQDDRVLAGYLCGRERVALSEAEIAQFFAAIVVRSLRAQ